MITTRRAVLLGGLGAALTGCSATPAATPPSRRPTTTTSARIVAAEPKFAELESTFSGRLGVSAVDTGSGRTVGHRADERFLLCSTFKALAVSAILRLRQERSGLLDEVIHYDAAKLLSHAPVTSQHVADGMTVAALCEATITQSDNTAANLLLEILGGPAGATAFARTLGDEVTRMDRTEPELNNTTPGDERDTSTPGQMATTLRALALDDGLDPDGRDLLVGWLTANVTGERSIRAGVPAGWRVGDKTGSGSQGEVNDIAVVWPPDHAPLVIAVYTAPNDPNSEEGYATVAEAARIAIEAIA